MLQQSHDRTIKTQKSVWETQEKVRRDKWFAEKSKSIKEATVKSLEPDIQRILSVIFCQVRHQQLVYLPGGRPIEPN